MGGSRIMVRADDGVCPLRLAPPGAGAPLLNSTATAWEGVPFELHDTLANPRPTPATPVQGEYHLRVVLDGFYEIELSDRGRSLVRRGVPGTMSFHAGEGPRPTRIAAAARTLVVKIDQAWLHRVRGDTPVPAGIRPLGHGDATARELARAMCREVQQGAPNGDLFAESLSLSLLSYALGRLPRGDLSVRGGLSELHYRRVREHVEAHLGSPLAVAELAALCGLQSRQFGALFRHSFGTTPHRYIVDRRLARAAEQLRRGRPDLAQLATELGFASQSHFTTAFRRAHGVPPARYARG